MGGSRDKERVSCLAVPDRRTVEKKGLVMGPVRLEGYGYGFLACYNDYNDEYPDSVSDLRSRPTYVTVPPKPLERRVGTVASSAPAIISWTQVYQMYGMGSSSVHTRCSQVRSTVSFLPLPHRWNKPDSICQRSLDRRSPEPSKPGSLPSESRDRALARPRQPSLDHGAKYSNPRADQPVSSPYLADTIHASMSA
ncbi:hypothetical protein VUR80DRAFT_4529 [Thermomyces stellatus]